jgi:hypothetical protein
MTPGEVLKKVVLYEIYREISTEILLTSENIFPLLGAT